MKLADLFIICSMRSSAIAPEERTASNVRPNIPPTINPKRNKKMAASFTCNKFLALCFLYRTILSPYLI